MMVQEFVGSGLAFPMRTDATGRIALVSDHTEIQEAIRLVLATAYGERPMRPEFGCGIHDFVFAPVDASTAGRLRYEVQLSLTRWEPRIEIADIVVSLDEQERSTLYIDIQYVIKGSNDPRNLVFPFYT